MPRNPPPPELREPLPTPPPPPPRRRMGMRTGQFVTIPGSRHRFADGTLLQQEIAVFVPDPE